MSIFSCKFAEIVHTRILESIEISLLSIVLDWGLLDVVSITRGMWS